MVNASNGPTSSSVGYESFFENDDEDEEEEEDPDEDDLESRYALMLFFLKLIELVNYLSTTQIKIK